MKCQNSQSKVEKGIKGLDKWTYQRSSTAKGQKAPHDHVPWAGPEDTIYQSEEECVGVKGTSIREKFSGGCHLLSGPASESSSISHTR